MAHPKYRLTRTPFGERETVARIEFWSRENARAVRGRSESVATWVTTRLRSSRVLKLNLVRRHEEEEVEEEFVPDADVVDDEEEDVLLEEEDDDSVVDAKLELCAYRLNASLLQCDTANTPRFPYAAAVAR